MLKNDEAFYVYDPETGRIRYTVNAPAPLGLIDTWSANGEKWVIGVAAIDIQASYVPPERARDWRNTMLPLYAEKLAASERVGKLYNDIEELSAAIAPYAGKDRELLTAGKQAELAVAEQNLEVARGALKVLEAGVEAAQEFIDGAAERFGAIAVPRPVQEGPRELSIPLGTSAKIALPMEACLVEVDGQSAGVHDDGEFEIEPAESGMYTVTVTPWPTMPFQVLVEVV